MYRKLIAMLCCAMLAICGLTGCSYQSSSLRFGTAGIGGTYYQVGTALADLLNQENMDVTVEIRETDGSAANIRLLDGKYIQLAIAQADMINDAFYAEGSYKGSAKNRGFRAVAGLYPEACQIVVLADSDIMEVSDLLGKTVSVGASESGTAENAEQILSASGLSGRMLTQKNMTYTESAAALTNREIDAFFVTAGATTSVIEELAEKTPIRLLSIDAETQARLMAGYSFYESYVIPAGSYTGQTEDVSTLGIRSVLLVGSTLSDDTVYRITKALYDHMEELTEASGRELNRDPQMAVDRIPIPFHKGAAAYYAEQGIEVNTVVDTNR